MLNKKHILIVSLILAIAIAGCSTKSIENSNEKSVNSVDRFYNLDPQRQFIGQQIADYHFVNLVTGEQIHLDEVYKDKIVFIQSFSIGCPACVQGITDYNELYEKYDGKIEVIYMDINPNDKKEDILSVKQEFNGKDWVWVEYSGSLLPFYENFNFNLNDMTFIVDKSGKIAYADSFSVPLSRLEEALKEII